MVNHPPRRREAGGVEFNAFECGVNMSEEQKDARLRWAIHQRKEHAECNYDYDDDDGGFTDDDAIEELMGECGQDRHGSCSLAGTEYCDWDCPFS
jgi:hypothetical protein